jgi:hypothetical protein
MGTCGNKLTWVLDMGDKNIGKMNSESRNGLEGGSSGSIELLKLYICHTP